jgi:hypothetical protein
MSDKTGMVRPRESDFRWFCADRQGFEPAIIRDSMRMTGIAFVLFALAGKSTSKKALAPGCAECETTLLL